MKNLKRYITEKLRLDGYKVKIVHFPMYEEPIGELINRIGQEGLIKYIGFSVIMIAIAITGMIMKKDYKLYRKLHIIFTIGFFVYLPIAIKFL